MKHSSIAILLLLISVIGGFCFFVLNEESEKSQTKTTNSKDHRLPTHRPDLADEERREDTNIAIDNTPKNNLQATEEESTKNNLQATEEESTKNNLQATEEESTKLEFSNIENYLNKNGLPALNNEDDLLDLAKSDPGIVEPLFLDFALAEPYTEEYNLLMKAFIMSKGKWVIPTLLDKLADHNEPDKQRWSAVLGSIGVHNVEDRNKLIEVLNLSDDPIFVSDIILGVSSYSPQTYAEKQESLAQIEKYLHDSDPVIRSSAILGASRFRPRTDTAYIEAGLESPDQIVKSAAIRAISENGITSETSKLKLLGMISDKGEHIVNRLDAYSALRWFDLGPDEYDLVKRFEKTEVP